MPTCLIVAIITAAAHLPNTNPFFYSFYVHFCFFFAIIILPLFSLYFLYYHLRTSITEDSRAALQHCTEQTSSETVQCCAVNQLSLTTQRQTTALTGKRIHMRYCNVRWFVCICQRMLFIISFSFISLFWLCCCTR